LNVPGFGWNAALDCRAHLRSLHTRFTPAALHAPHVSALVYRSFSRRTRCTVYRAASSRFWLPPRSLPAVLWFHWNIHRSGYCWFAPRYRYHVCRFWVSTPRGLPTRLGSPGCYGYTVYVLRVYYTLYTVATLRGRAAAATHCILVLLGSRALPGLRYHTTTTVPAPTATPFLHAHTPPHGSLTTLRLPHTTASHYGGSTPRLIYFYCTAFLNYLSVFHTVRAPRYFSVSVRYTWLYAVWIFFVTCAAGFNTTHHASLPTFWFLSFLVVHRPHFFYPLRLFHFTCTARLPSLPHRFCILARIHSVCLSPVLPLHTLVGTTFHRFAFPLRAWFASLSFLPSLPVSPDIYAVHLYYCHLLRLRVEFTRRDTYARCAPPPGCLHFAARLPRVSRLVAYTLLRLVHLLCRTKSSRWFSPTYPYVFYTVCHAFDSFVGLYTFGCTTRSFRLRVLPHHACVCIHISPRPGRDTTRGHTRLHHLFPTRRVYRIGPDYHRLGLLFTPFYMVLPTFYSTPTLTPRSFTTLRFRCVAHTLPLPVHCALPPSFLPHRSYTMPFGLPFTALPDTCGKPGLRLRVPFLYRAVPFPRRLGLVYTWLRALQTLHTRTLHSLRTLRSATDATFCRTRTCALPLLPAFHRGYLVAFATPFTHIPRTLHYYIASRGLVAAHRIPRTWDFFFAWFVVRTRTAATRFATHVFAGLRLCTHLPASPPHTSAHAISLRVFCATALQDTPTYHHRLPTVSHISAFRLCSPYGFAIRAGSALHTLHFGSAHTFVLYIAFTFTSVHGYTIAVTCLFLTLTRVHVLLHTRLHPFPPHLHRVYWFTTTVYGSLVSVHTHFVYSHRLYTGFTAFLPLRLVVPGFHRFYTFCFACRTTRCRFGFYACTRLHAPHAHTPVHTFWFVHTLRVGFLRFYCNCYLSTPPVPLPACWFTRLPTLPHYLPSYLRTTDLTAFPGLPCWFWLRFYGLFYSFPHAGSAPLTTHPCRYTSAFSRSTTPHRILPGRTVPRFTPARFPVSAWLRHAVLRGSAAPRSRWLYLSPVPEHDLPAFCRCISLPVHFAWFTTHAPAFYVLRHLFATYAHSHGFFRRSLHHLRTATVAAARTPVCRTRTLPRFSFLFHTYLPFRRVPARLFLLTRHAWFWVLVPPAGPPFLHLVTYTPCTVYRCGCVAWLHTPTRLLHGLHTRLPPLTTVYTFRLVLSSTVAAPPFLPRFTLAHLSGSPVLTFWFQHSRFTSYTYGLNYGLPGLVTPFRGCLVLVYHHALLRTVLYVHRRAVPLPSFTAFARLLVYLAGLPVAARASAPPDATTISRTLAPGTFLVCLKFCLPVYRTDTRTASAPRTCCGFTSFGLRSWFTGLPFATFAFVPHTHAFGSATRYTQLPASFPSPAHCCPFGHCYASFTVHGCILDTGFAATIFACTTAFFLAIHTAPFRDLYPPFCVTTALSTALRQVPTTASPACAVTDVCYHPSGLCILRYPERRVCLRDCHHLPVTPHWFSSPFAFLRVTGFFCAHTAHVPFRFTAGCCVLPALITLVCTHRSRYGTTVHVGSTDTAPALQVCRHCATHTRGSRLYAHGYGDTLLPHTATSAMHRFRWFRHTPGCRLAVRDALRTFFAMLRVHFLPHRFGAAHWVHCFMGLRYRFGFATWVTHTPYTRTLFSAWFGFTFYHCLTTYISMGSACRDQPFPVALRARSYAAVGLPAHFVGRAPRRIPRGTADTICGYATLCHCARAAYLLRTPPPHAHRTPPHTMPLPGGFGWTHHTPLRFAAPHTTSHCPRRTPFHTWTLPRISRARIFWFSSCGYTAHLSHVATRFPHCLCLAHCGTRFLDLHGSSALRFACSHSSAVSV